MEKIELGVYDIRFLCFLEFIGPLTIAHGDLDARLLNILPVDPQSRLHDITRCDRPDSLRRTSKHNVALLQSHYPANITQLARDAEQHELCVVSLLDLAVHAQPKMSILRIGDPRLGNQVADGHESVETLCNGPRESLFLCFLLYVTSSHVDGEEVAWFVGG